MTTRGGAPLTGARLSGVLSRPATEAGRRPLAFRETAPGEYVAEAKGLAGAWDLALTARDPGGRVFEAERRLLWPR
jgi:nitrogen fixation protein FixH